MSSPKQTPTYSEPEYAKSDKPKTDYPWYLPSIDKRLIPETRQLLQSYSKIPLDQQSQHVHEIRDRAWAIRSYPCTGLGAWLDPFLRRSPAYPRILPLLQAGGTLLDIGCFLGGDLRRLVFDGAPSDNLYGVDIVSHWDVGFALFRDEGRFNAHFVEADILAPDALPELRGRMDVISISAVLHQWDWQGQVDAAKKVAAFSKPGSLVVGYQIGNVEAQQLKFKMSVPQWRHDPASFDKMWNQVGAETGSKWETKARLLTWEDIGLDPAETAFMDPGDRILDFVVTRTS